MARVFEYMVLFVTAVLGTMMLAAMCYVGLITQSDAKFNFPMDFALGSGKADRAVHGLDRLPHLRVVLTGDNSPADHSPFNRGAYGRRGAVGGDDSKRDAGRW
ncbi:hypothetical protein DUT91_09565 [Phyllobacterium salinisoli]|uniref:Uncharacterized protein n=1 Tax=Phyllobacterium salinisoli TaxID=1899321 RepID=A0A368K5J6_9HYPH|nr:hypothetical protein [Phyllobacterium salinisoli]RCS24501.1 hypothetical protein DUT91_09565 [Phyllobacterium salinisoli]